MSYKRRTSKKVQRNVRRGRKITTIFLAAIMMCSQFQYIAQALPDVTPTATTTQSVTPSATQQNNPEPSKVPSTTPSAAATPSEEATPSPSVTPTPTTPQPTSSAEETDAAQPSEKPAATADVGGHIAYLGPDAFQQDQIQLVLYANGTPTDNTASLTAGQQGTYTYKFSKVPVYDKNGDTISYTVHDKRYDENSSSRLYNLYHVHNGKRETDTGTGVAPAVGFVYVHRAEIAGAYRIEKEDEEPGPGDVAFAVSTQSEADAAYIPTNAGGTLTEADTTWRTAKLPTHNPLTQQPIVYRVNVAGAVDNYVMAYENVAAHEAETDAAYNGGAIVARCEVNQLFSLFGFGPQDITYTTTGTTSFVGELNWNDNSADTRPTPDIRPIYFRVPTAGITEYAELTEEVLKAWGVSDGDIALILAAPALDSTTAYNSWKYTYANLPAQLVDETMQQHDIEYSFDLTAASKAEIENDYFYDKVSESKIMLTKKMTANFTKIWKDSNNQYSTRPSEGSFKSNVTLSRMISGGTLEAVGTLTALGGKASVSGTNSATWQVSVSDLPMYDELGRPYIYTFKEADDSFALASGSDFDGSSVTYKAKYENVGNYAEQTDRCYVGGTVVNTLTDTVEYKATKLWQDDGTQQRPEGTLYLYHYPRLPGMDYTKATPVSGMQLALDNAPANNFSYTIDFSSLPDYPAGGLPRFDNEGNEYVYFVQEILSGQYRGDYTRYYDYGGETPPDTRDINALFNGGTLQNRRTGHVDIPVTKTWKAAAKQDMNSKVEILVEHRQKGTNDAFTPVGSVGTDGNGIYEMDGFRAEVMEQTHVFSGLPQFNDKGLEYEYRVSEYAVDIDGNRVALSGVPETDGKKTVNIAGATYELSQKTESDGSVTLTNRLVGEAEVRIYKVWNGKKDGHDWAQVNLNIYRDGAAVPASEGTITVKDKNGDVVGTRNGYYLEVSETEQHQTSGAPVTKDADWLVVSGLPRYDEQGREYKYTVTETGISGYYASYSTVRTEDAQTKLGIVETTVTNTPTEEGAHIEVRKEWADDGDENCREPIVVDLYYSKDGTEPYELLKSAELTAANDWLTWISLTGQKTSGERDLDHTHYYVKERSIKKGTEYPVTYSTEFPTLTDSYGSAPVGTVTSHAHSYNVFAKKNAAGSQYSFRNVRTGTVNIQMDKKWVDNDYHTTRTQEVTFEVRRWLNYTDESTATDEYEVKLDGTPDLNGEAEAWKAASKSFDKYDENGVLYHYKVVETTVKDLTNNDVHDASGGGYTLNDGLNHRYGVSVEADKVYGEHVGGSTPVADEYAFHVTNARTDTVDFKVYKLWKDVVRTDIDENNKLTADEKALEVKKRPDIYLTLYQTIEGGSPTVVSNYVERVWRTTGGDYNDYYWECSFDPMPRYTADGKEIVYSVKEEMQFPGEYYTKYFTGKPAAVTGNDAAALANVTTIPIFDVSGAELSQAYAQNGDTIVNGRTGSRTLSGQKIWLNVPTNVSAENFPVITLKLHIYEFNNQANKYEYKGKDGYAELSLDSGKKNFTFGDGSQTLDRYDSFGTLIRYQAKEVSNLTHGYKVPVYDDYNLTVTNEYKVGDLDASEKVSVHVTKAWDITSIGSIPAGQEPTANIKLYRQLTDGLGNGIAGTEEYTGEYVNIQYPATAPATNPVFKDLARYGYNGHAWKYYVKESINGYEVTGTTADMDPDEQKFQFDVKNTYTGKKYVKLGGEKAWSDQSDKFGTRPNDLALKVYRSVSGLSGSTEEITDHVTVEWSNKTSNSWAYVVKAKDSTTGDSTAGEASLYRYAPNGGTYIYYVEEVKPNHHYTMAAEVGTAVILGSTDNLTLQGVASGDNVTASFKNTLITTSFSLDKTWLKNQGTAALESGEFNLMLPSSITFKVQYSTDGGSTWADYTDKGSAVITKDFTKANFQPSTGNSKQLTISGLPKYDLASANELKYRAVETIIDGKTVSSDKAAGFTVTYDRGTNPDTISNEVETIELLLKKTWNDNNNQDGVRPTSITFKITRDGEVNKTMTVTVPASELTTGKTVYVPKYKADGTESTYTVEEQLTTEQKKYYTLENETSNGSYTLPDPGTSGTKTYSFVNNHDEIEISLTAAKNWSDAGIGETIGNGASDANLNAIRPNPQQVEVKIQRSADSGTSWVDMTSSELGGQQPTVMIGSGAPHTWTGLIARYNPVEGDNSKMVRYQYRVVETAIKGYTPTYRKGSTGAYSGTPASITDTDCTNLAGTIEVQNRLDTTKFDVEKSWATLGSEFAQKPDVVVQLQYRLSGEPSWQDAAGTNNTRTLNEAGSYKATFSNLPKENNAGVAYEYTVKEVSIGGNAVNDAAPPYSYIPSVGTVADNKVTVTNTLQTRENIKVTKVWDDNNNQDGVRKSETEVQVKLIKDLGAAYSITSDAVTLNESNNWTYTFENLPKYRPDGTACTYQVKETKSLSGYTTTYQVGANAYTSTTESEAVPDTAGINVNVKNSYTPKKMNLEVRKNWSTDLNNKYGVRPASIKLQLYVSTNAAGTQDRKLLDTQVVTSAITDPQWTYTWTGLDIMQNETGDGAAAGTSVQLYYSVVELNATDDSAAPIYGYKTPVYEYAAATNSKGEGHTNSVNGSTKDTTEQTHIALVNNRLNSEAKVNVTKIWETQGSSLAPKGAVVVKLLQRPVDVNTDWEDMTPIVGTKELTGSGNPIGLFSGLPVADSRGVAYEYKVEEVSIGGVAIAPGGSYETTYATTVQDTTTTATVTNTLKTRKDITVTKEWNDSNDRDGLRKNIEVELLRDGAGTGVKVSLTAENSWTNTFTKLPKYKLDGTEYIYKVKEVTALSGYTTEYQVGSGSYASGTESEAVPDTAGINVNIKNSHTPTTMSLTATKSWNDTSNQYGLQPAGIKLQLYSSTSADGTQNRTAYGTPKDVAGPGWSCTWDNLPVKQNPSGTSQQMYYSVVELKADGTAAPLNGYLAPTYTYTKAGGSNGGKNENTVHGSPSDASGLVHTVTVTNALDTVKVNVAKDWQPANNAMAPKGDVVVKLMQRVGSGQWQELTSAGTKTLSSPNYTNSFSGLPRANASGNAYEYTVAEVSIGGATASNAYTVTVENTPTAAGFDTTVTNTLKTRNSIKVTKEWDDENNQDGKRPSSVQVTLIRDKGVVGSELTTAITLNASNNWTHTFTNLPKYRLDGTEYTYHVKETAGATGYTATYRVGSAAYTSGTESEAVPDTANINVNVKNTYTPVTMNLTATKNWSDDNNQYGFRPAQVKLQLYASTSADGTENRQAVGSPQTVSGPAWSYTWLNLPIMRNASSDGSGASQLLYYSVVELNADNSAAPIKGYTAPVYGYALGGGSGSANTQTIAGSPSDTSGLTHTASVTNTMDTVSVTAAKVWNDFGNLYGSRPDELTFELQWRKSGSGAAFNNQFPSGTSVSKPMTPEAFSNTQSISFAGLPKYTASGDLIEYRVVETKYTVGGSTNPVTPESGNAAKGSFTVSKSPNTFTYDYETVVSDYTSTTTNELEQEKISLKGTKTWADANNRFGTRPQQDLKLKVFHSENDGTSYTELPEANYSVNWTRNDATDTWDYEIPALPRYKMGSTTLILYKVVEVAPAHYKQTSPVIDSNNLDGHSVGTVDVSTSNITGVDFTNALDTGTILTVEKQKDRGPDSTEFTFAVYLSDAPISEANSGTLYKGGYDKYNSTDNIASTPIASGTTLNGHIMIKAGEKFVLRDLPLDFYYKVVEQQHAEYVLEEGASSGLSGQLGGTLLAESNAVAVNRAQAELGITNTTEASAVNGYTKAGGKVTVICSGGDTPHSVDKDDNTDKVGVAWLPDEHWEWGNTLTIYYTEFGSTEEKSLTVSGYWENGVLKGLHTSKCSSTADLDRFLTCGACFKQRPDGTVELHLAANSNDMPRKTRVDVLFKPTLAARNATENAAGGTVMVENGSASNVADGVPALGGKPYANELTVHAKADEGHQLRADRILVRNMNDLDGAFVTLDVQADGSFTQWLSTTLNGANVKVQVAGRVEYTYDANGNAVSARVVFNELPVPLQVDFLFEKIKANSDDTDGGKNPDSTPSQNNDGPEKIIPIGNNSSKKESDSNAATSDVGVPQTGDDTPLGWLLLLFGAAASAIALLMKKRSKE